MVEKNGPCGQKTVNLVLKKVNMSQKNGLYASKNDQFGPKKVTLALQIGQCGLQCGQFVP